MAAANGTLTPPVADGTPSTNAPSTISATKRKREDEPAPQPPTSNPGEPEKSKQTQRDILEILEHYDTTPSFLNHDFDDVGSPSSTEPSQKKARLLDGSGRTSISAKLRNGAYPALHLLRQDAARVSRALEASSRAKAKQVEGQNGGHVSLDGLKQIQRMKAFEQLMLDVVEKESHYRSTHIGAYVKHEVGRMVNGHVADTRAGHRPGTVLTLFGNAPTPKQLFSSMQNAAAGQRDVQTIESELPVEELSLPNGLTATHLLPAPDDPSKKGPTFEESFPSPYNLPALHPPKAQKRSSTRDTTITWEFKNTVNRSSKKGGYTVQSLNTGDWLSYEGVDSAQSPKEKRKQRDRALSSGAESTKEPPSKASLEETQAKEEEALFRQAYGSFAPNVDNAKSIIPVETKSMIWWEKMGEKRYNDAFAIDPALLDGSITDPVKSLPVPEIFEAKEEDLERVIQELDDVDDDMTDIETVTSKTDVERVLRDVSELLKTLASHQRIRNSSLPSSTAPSRNPLSPAPVLAAMIGKPDEPAEAELSTYHALRRELAYLLLKLPPYAVAKVDGEQLAELGVSQVISYQSKDFKGTMEEDQVARLAKYNALATAAATATLTRGSSTSGQHYSTTAQRTPAIGQAANTRYAQNSQYGISRTPATQPPLQRSTSNQSYSTPTAAVARPSYGQQPSQYTRPGATQQAYGQPNGQQQYYQQRTQPTPSTYGSYGQQYSQQTPATQQRPTYSTSQPLAQYQQRAQTVAANAVAYQTNAAGQSQQHVQSPFNRTASPAKPVTYGQTPQQQQNVQPRPGYPMQPQQQYAQQLSGSGRATPSYPSQPQTPVNGYQQRPPPPAVAPRAASGTPQPPPQLLTQQVQAQVQAQANGYA